MYNPIYIDYSLDSLEPYIDYETMNIHYNNIYMNLLHNLNSLLNNKYNYSLKYLIEHIDIIPLSIRGEVLYYLSSVLNHNLYFYNISDKHNNIPVGKIKEDIDKNFGSFNNFKKEFINSATNLKGSGYTFLVKDKDNKLKIINTSNDDSPYSYNLTPILVLDLWEHAYFLKYKDNKEAYINNFFEILDFEKVNNYYQKL